MKEIRKFIAEYPDLWQYLPDPCEMDKLPKQWVVNVIYKANDVEFRDWVKARILKRNEKLVVEKKLAINMDPAVMKAFLNSTAVSSKLNHHLSCIDSILTHCVHRFSLKGYWL